MSSHSTPRLWLSALLAWVAMLAAILIVVSAGMLGDGLQDPDIHSHAELAVAIVMVTAVPLLLTVVAVFAPIMYLFGLASQGHASRPARALVGLAMTLPACVVFFLVSRMTTPRHAATLIEDAASLMAHPGQLLPVLILLAFGGLVFGLTFTRTSRT